MCWYRPHLSGDTLPAELTGVNLLTKQIQQFKPKAKRQRMLEFWSTRTANRIWISVAHPAVKGPTRQMLYEPLIELYQRAL